MLRAWFLVVLALGLAMPGMAEAETGFVEGRVTDATGRPLDASVRAGDGPSTDTGADGRYRLAVEPGPTTIEFSANHELLADEYYGGTYVQAPLIKPDEVVVEPGRTVGGIDGQLDRPVAVGGRVTDAAGVLRAGVTVSVVVQTYQGPRSIGVGDVSNRDGEWSRGNLPPVPMRIVAYGTEHGEADVWYPASPRSEAAAVLRPAPGSAQTNLDFQLVPGETIVGRVVDDHGDPVSDAYVRATSDDPLGTGGGGGETDADGRYRITDLAPGSQELRVFGVTTMDAYPPTTTVRRGEIADAGTTTSVSAVKIHGTIVDVESGRPVPDIQVRFRRNDAPDQGWSEASTYSDGSFRSERLPVGRYRLEVIGDGYARRWVGGSSYETADVVEPAPRATARVEGTVRRGGGAIAGVVQLGNDEPAGVVAMVRVLTPDREVVASEQAYVTRDGRYRLPGLPEGSYRVRLESVLGAPQFFAGAETFADATAVRVVAGTTRDGVDARLTPRGRMSVTVRDAGENLLVRFYDAETGDIQASRFTDADGRVDSGPIPAGRYVVGFGYRVGEPGSNRYYDDVASFDRAKDVIVRDDATTRVDDARYGPRPTDDAPDPPATEDEVPERPATADDVPGQPAADAGAPASPGQRTAAGDGLAGVGAPAAEVLTRTLRLRRGAIVVPVRCRPRCRGTVRLTARGRLLARGTLRPGARRQTLRATSRGRRAARRGTRATLTILPIGGRVTRAEVRITAAR